MDMLSPLELVDLINLEDVGVAEAVGSERLAIARAIELAVEAFRSGGRLIYSGCGNVGTAGCSGCGGDAADLWNRS